MLHLVHPALVHFTVAFVIVGGATEVWGLLFRRESLARWGGQLVLVGLVSLVPTIVTGYLAANTASMPKGSLAWLDSHERNGLILLGALLVSQFWKAWCRGRLPPSHVKPYSALLALLVLLTAYSAWLGGMMVYRYGAGVLPS